MVSVNPDPVDITGDTTHKVTLFVSPDHSIKPLVELIESAEQSIDIYIPGLKNDTSIIDI